MDKQAFVTGSFSNEQKLLLARAYDLCMRAKTREIPTFTPFLNPSEQALVLSKCVKFTDLSVNTSGGYDGAERRILSFSPFYNYDQTPPAFPICTIRIAAKDGSLFSHRDYLGSILSLGVKRETTGDIVLLDGCAYLFCEKNISDFFVQNLKKVSNTPVNATLYDQAVTVPEHTRFRQVSQTVSSMRLDCVVSAMANKPRAAAAQLIQSGMVQKNYSVAQSVSQQVSDGDILSVRGVGKAVIATDGRRTKKDRVHITIKYYI